MRFALSLSSRRPALLAAVCCAGAAFLALQVLLLQTPRGVGGGGNAQDAVRAGSAAAAAPPPPPEPRDLAALPPERRDVGPLRVYSDGAMPGMLMYQIPRACVTSEGSVLVPGALAPLPAVKPWKRRLGRLLAFYDAESEPPGMRDPGVTRRHAGVHVVGTTPLRPHMPHFAEDLLAHTFPMMRHIQRQMDAPRESAAAAAETRARTATVRCYDPVSGSDGDESSCAPDLAMLPTVLIDEKARSWTWDLGLLDMLRRQSTTAPLRAMFTDEIFPPERASGDVRIACFESISFLAGTAQRDVYPYSVVSSEAVDEVLGQLPDLVRDIPPLPASAACSLNVTIINRPVSEATKIFSGERRRVVNMQAVVDAIKEEAERLNISVAMSVREDFDAASFQEQVNVMQQTHSIVSVHGAELGNLLFVRKGTSLVEVLPFRYASRIFEQTASFVGANHVASLADPHMESFETCLREKQVYGRLPRNDTELEIEEFRADAAAYYEARAAGNASSAGVFLDKRSSHIAFNARVCARSQPLVVPDPKLVAREALRNYSQLCYKSPPSSRS